MKTQVINTIRNILNLLPDSMKGKLIKIARTFQVKEDQKNLEKLDEQLISVRERERERESCM